MPFGIKMEIWGERALFSRPELSAERMSYDVITPSAARGIVESVMWHPGMRYVIDKIHVLNPITFTSVRRNEVKAKALASAMRSYVDGKKAMPYIDRQDNIQQRASVILSDVHYLIELHFEMTEDINIGDTAAKFYNMLRRRLQNGQCYSQPYLGAREFPAYVSLYENDEPPIGAYSEVEMRDLGLMLYDMDYSNSQDYLPMFYRAVMRHGVINVSESEVYR